MDVRIGVTYSAREIDLQLADDTDREALREQVDESLGGGTGVLWLTDKRGRQVGVPADKVAYVELGSDSDGRSIGFSS
ncbi:MAG: DUF3107 domain-containing protein [Microthrixaceae bacterium]|nr:DUF3107 domain-containing protein [Microthrixaceae bacterium]MCB1012589.1 DUF3107 domain-containing protein [Microthrixaceae bacterium]MCB9387992.1 DUF3107 domain-containing protein [Microthrixaceae bacterium]